MSAPIEETDCELEERPNERLVFIKCPNKGFHSNGYQTRNQRRLAFAINHPTSKQQE